MDDQKTNEKWKTGLAKAGSIFGMGCSAIMELSLFHKGPNKVLPNSTTFTGEMAQMLGGPLLNTVAAAAIGMAVAGPAGSVAAPLINFATGSLLSTAAMALPLAAASKAMNVASQAVGFLEKLDKRRAVRKMENSGASAYFPPKMT